MSAFIRCTLWNNLEASAAWVLLLGFEAINCVYLKRFWILMKIMYFEDDRTVLLDSANIS